MTNLLISARIPNLNFKNENLPPCGFCRPSGPPSQSERKRKERQVRRPYQRSKKAVEYEGDGDTNSNWRTWNGFPKAWKGDWNSWKSLEESRPFIVVIGANTKTSPGDRRKLALAQISVKDHMLTLVWKTHLDNNNNNNNNNNNFFNTYQVYLWRQFLKVINE